MRYPLVGAVLGMVVYGAALFMHGGVHAERGCVLDSPVYEIVNGPTVTLHHLGVPVEAEHIGESRPSPPPFHAAIVIGIGLAAWALLGGGLGLAGAQLRRDEA